MKTTLLATAFFFLLLSYKASSQIITPVIKANFGVEANLSSNRFTGMLSPNDDDWFPDTITTGSGVYLIDTAGAAAILNEYKINPGYRKNCFTRPMSYPVYSIVNGKFLYDAIYVRDHYKNDSTSFTSSNKNGQSPALWNGGVTPVPDKNDLNDVMVHVRRDGPNLTDSLWFFAGLSLLGNTGNRYFDLELYQTDIYYNSTDNKFYNYGPDEGHTSWQFDSLGNVISPGDVIFSAEFGSSSLTLLEARIWIDNASLSITPVAFNWGGLFDGDGSGAQYGYASILPKTGGNFYSGMQCAANTWAGPFGFIDVTDMMITNYDERNYMEIAVNMTKIGLDPYNILGSSGCNLSFRRFFAKTRSSTSFTSSLKDFVGPYKIARPTPAIALGDSAMFCGAEPDSSQLSVPNPVASSTYTWTTTDGHIVTFPATGPSIYVDKPGTYIVTQTLFSGCMPYATDTITIRRDSIGCLLLASENVYFTGRNNNSSIILNWTYSGKDITHFEIERSTDGRSFHKIASVNALPYNNTEQDYEFTDVLINSNTKLFYYRIKIIKSNTATYSKVISIKNSKAFTEDFMIVPNPARDYLQVVSSQNSHSKINIRVYSSNGSELLNKTLNNENEKMDIGKWAPGIYIVHVFSQDGQLQTKKKLYVTR